MLRSCLLGLALSTSASMAMADTLLIEGLQTAAATVAERPVRGLSMATVEARYGAPASRVSPVGDPPISRWEYPDFTVFFEHDRVIHAVVRR